MKSYYPNRFSTKWKIVWILIQFSIIGTGYYLFVYNSYGYKSWNSKIGGTLVVTAILFTFMTFVKSPKYSKWYQSKGFLFYLPSLILALGAIFLLLTKRTQYYEQEATIPTFAEVIRKERVKRLGGRALNSFDVYAVIKYFDKDKGLQIIQRLPDYDDRFKIGHYVPIMYSEDKPELFRIDFDFEE